MGNHGWCYCIPCMEEDVRKNMSNDHTTGVLSAYEALPEVPVSGRVEVAQIPQLQPRWIVEEDEDEPTKLPEAVVMTKDEILGVFRGAVAEARQELALKEAEKQIAEDRSKQLKDFGILQKHDRDIADAQWNLLRYQRQVRGLSVASPVSMISALGAGVMMSTDMLWTSGLTLLLLSLVGVLIFTGRLICVMFDAHNSTKKDNGTRQVSDHPADILRALEQKKDNWLNVA